MPNLRWKQIGALGGIIFVIMQLLSQALIQIGGSEPAFTAPSEEILTFFINRDLMLSGIGGYLSQLSPIPLLWFVGTLWAELQEYEQRPGWMSAVAFASGTVAVTILANMSAWGIAIFRIEDGLSAEMARTFFDQGNFRFASLWVAVGGFLLTTSIVALKDKALPRWLGWFGLFTAVLLFVARYFWAASGAVFLPYVLFWVWLIATCILIMRRTGQVRGPVEKLAMRQT